jgi:Peptidase family M1 domain
VVALDRRLEPGEPTEVTLDFRLQLGAGDFDRFGTGDGLAWWGSGAPLLAWEPGVGWAEDPFVDLGGETATSPAADTTVTVSAPEELTVLMTGATAEPRATGDGRRTWTATEPAARDVAVAVGEFRTAERTTPDGVRVTAGVLPGARLGAEELADRTVAAIDRLARRLGPFPYRTLGVPLLPDYGGGIEYPGLIFEATPGERVLVHEVAHMWFYGMVGNSQFRDPWLDEAFATWAEALDDRRSAGLAGALDRPGPVGGSMADYAGTAGYFDLVYGKGGAALLAAGQAAGPARFEAAIRCYADANAWSIATPSDLAAVLADLPPALTVLVDAQALDEADLPR